MLTLGIVLDVECDGFTAMRGLAGTDDERLIHPSDGAWLEVGALAAGMESGAPSAAFCFALPDGRVVLAETSLRLLLAAASALAARYGDPQ